MASQKKEKTVKKTQLPRLETFSNLKLHAGLPQFKAGDKIIVKTIIKEGDKERIQAFEGVCIARDGRGINETFTVRKISFGVGVERIFPLHSPMISGVEVLMEGFVRRAKLYYMRELSGKKARIQDKRLKLAAAMGATVGDLPPAGGTAGA